MLSLRIPLSPSGSQVTVDQVARSVDVVIASLSAATGKDWSKRVRRVESGCLEWFRAKNLRGYGKTFYQGRLWGAHRAVWTILVGPIPDGMFLCHHCDNPSCVDPSHIYVGTSSDNGRDAVARGRHGTQRYPEEYAARAAALGRRTDWSRGEDNHTAKLTEADVAYIRSVSGNTRALAERFGVHRTTIQRIRRGAAWAHSLTSGGGR